MTYQPTDLTVQLHCEGSPQHVMNGGPAGAIFPGWFLRVYQNEGYDDILPESLPAVGSVHGRRGEMQITSEQAVHLCGYIDEYLGLGGRLHAAVTATDKEVLRRYEQRLANARAAADSIPALERAIESLRR